MKLTTQGRYAVTAMLDLALHYQGQPVVLAEIGRRQEIPLAYSDFLSRTSLAELMERHPLCQASQAQERAIKFRALRRERCLNSAS